MIPEIIPMELSIAQDPFDSDEHIFQIKWDGVRCLGGNYGGSTRLTNRRLNDRTAQYPELVRELSGFLPEDSLLDGEIVTLSPQGKPDFYRLLRRDLVKSAYRAELLSKCIPVYYMVFDILYLKGENLMPLPLTKRQERLHSLMPKSENIIEVESTEYNGTGLFSVIAQQGLEGIVAKKKLSTYIPAKRSSDWLKIKALRRLDAVIGGYTYSNGASFMLGTYIENELYYIGSAGTGLTEKASKEVIRRLEKHPAQKCPFINAKQNSKINWSQPLIKVRVKYLEQNSDFKLRHPVIEQILED